MPKEEVGGVRTIGRQAVRLSCLGVRGVDGRLLHAAELGLAGVRRHGRGCRRGQNVRVGPGGGEETAGEVAAFSVATTCARARDGRTWRGRGEESTGGPNGGCIRCW